MKKTIGIGILAGFLGMGLFYFTAKAVYYVKVVRTVGRLLEASHTPIEF